MKFLKYIIGFLFVGMILTLMFSIAWLPTWFIGPENKWSQTICYFIFLTVFLGEMWFLVLILSKGVKK